MPIQMELARIFIREMTDMQVIELKELDGDRSFPIVIGLPEAFAIERRLKGVEVPRPQTHDLLSTLITQLGARLDRIIIHELFEGTFYAMLCIDHGGQEIDIDCRPSDAIALGVAEGVPIFVSEQVLNEMEQDAAPDPDPPGESGQPPHDWD
ncbi:MAG: bifunctional nuclease family protein [Phycisphaerales bacterium]|nr:bifunctional nuclease family protein [Phycisphaerales bacterium]